MTLLCAIAALATRLNCAVSLCEITRHTELLVPFLDNGGLAVMYTLIKVCDHAPAS